jgi:hypothetical protein
MSEQDTNKTEKIKERERDHLPQLALLLTEGIMRLRKTKTMMTRPR